MQSTGTRSIYFLVISGARPSRLRFAFGPIIMPTDDQIREALRGVKYPGFSRDIVSFGIVKDIAISGTDATIKMTIATRDAEIPQTIHDESIEALRSVEGLESAQIDFDIQEPPEAPSGVPGQAGSAKASIPGVKHIIAVASGKGGVGKSTVSANLAAALAATGGKVGLCDCDLYGPSIAHMFGADDQRPLANEENEIQPIVVGGLKLMSMGFLLDDSAPVIVRGPLATRYTQQFLRQVEWGELDYLILDLPPGTGDIQLTIVQTVALDGAVIVTTPQEVALIDARKAVSMFGKVNVPILGFVENMSYFECPSDGVRYPIFGEGGGQREADKEGAPLLGQIPIDIPTREAGDGGKPIVLAQADSPAAKAFAEVATSIRAIVAKA